MTGCKGEQLLYPGHDHGDGDGDGDDDDDDDDVNDDIADYQLQLGGKSGLFCLYFLASFSQINYASLKISN